MGRRNKVQLYNDADNHSNGNSVHRRQFIRSGSRHLDDRFRNWKYSGDCNVPLSRRNSLIVSCYAGNQVGMSRAVRIVNISRTLISEGLIRFTQHRGLSDLDNIRIASV
jgi:hypothetical protein